MSDAVTSAAPAAASPTPTAEAKVDAALAPEKKDAGTGTPAPTPAEVKAEKRRYRVKIEGLEEEVDEDTLVSNYQKNKAADKRLQETSEERKRAREAKELGKKDIVRAYKEFFEVDDPYAEMERLLADRYRGELLQKADPKAYELSQKEKAIAEREERIKAYEDQQNAVYREQQELQHAQNIRQTFGGAVEKLGISPADPEYAEAISYMVDAAISALDNDMDLSPEDLAAEARERFNRIASKGKQKYAQLEGDALINELGTETVEKVRKALLAKAKASKAQPPPPQKAPEPAAPKAQEYRNDSAILREILRGGR